jgi:hypothetical protein
MQMCRGKSHFFQKWLLVNVSESGEPEQNRLASLASPSKPGWRISASLASPTHFQKGSFWQVFEFSNSPKMANFRGVLEFNKFAVEWPLLKKTLCLFYEKHLSISLHFSLVQTLN